GASTFSRLGTFRRCEIAPRLLPRSAGCWDIFLPGCETNPPLRYNYAVVPAARPLEKARPARVHLWGGVARAPCRPGSLPSGCPLFPRSARFETALPLFRLSLRRPAPRTWLFHLA